MILYTPKHKVPFQVDEADVEAISYYSWFEAGELGLEYIRTAVKNYSGVGNRQRQIALHQFLLGPAPERFEWDHRNRDRRDNRRDNLRLVTTVINQRNVGIQLDNTSGVKGVAKHGTMWRADISYNKQQIYLGCFFTIEEAALVRRKAEIELWGDEC